MPDRGLGQNSLSRSGNESMIVTLLIVLLVLLILGALPTWPYSAGWGPYPSGALVLVLIIILVFFLMGGHRVPW